MYIYTEFRFYKIILIFSIAQSFIACQPELRPNGWAIDKLLDLSRNKKMNIYLLFLIFHTASKFVG